MYGSWYISSLLALSLWASYAYAIGGSNEICFKDLGCFKNGGDFHHPVYRPVDLLPQQREVINTRFSLYTKQNTREPYYLSADDKEKLKEAPINTDVWTRFIVHGFLDTELFGKWQEALKNELLLHSDINCIIVDWSGGNKPPYVQATANTRVVGAEIAFLIKVLVEIVGLNLEKVHIIGHSLGSHIAGYAGERTKELARITALDPAEPFFQYMPTVVRLDPTDALFVDAIHTDAKTILLLGLGMVQQVGHLDFYPNNGREQPGCKASKITSFIIDGLVEGGRRLASCNHQRAIDFFMTTVNYKACTPVGIGCKDWDTFLDGKCTDCGKNGSNCGIMGLRAYEYAPHKSDKLQPKKYLKTTGKSPYCLFHFVVTVKLYKAKKSRDETGKIKITLNGVAKDAIVDLSDKDLDLYHGSTYQSLYTTSLNLGDIKSVSFTWQHKKSLKPGEWGLLKKHSLFVEYVRVTPLNIIDREERDSQTNNFCFGPEKAIVSGQIATFIKDC